MDKQLRRLAVAWMLRNEGLQIFDTSLSEFCELVGGTGEPNRQVTFDRVVNTACSLVFPDSGYRKAYNTAKLSEPRTNLEALPEAYRQVVEASRVMERHWESLAKLDDDNPRTGWVGDCYVVGNDAGTVYHAARNLVTTSLDTIGIPCAREQFEERYPQARLLDDDPQNPSAIYPEDMGNGEDFYEQDDV